MSSGEEKPLVVIRSLVYNHEPYLRDCLEGFVMQQTSFPFVAVVHDDCSTDGSAAIIREYAEKSPHIIKPVYETENQFSKKDGSLRRAISEACGKYGAKYYALCEGDDYWTDPRKLQKQVDFLETHPDYTMVCCNCEIHMPDKKLATHEDFIEAGWVHSDEDRELTAEETFEQHGRYAHTAGLVYRAQLMASDCYERLVGLNGDIRLQFTAVTTGRLYHMKDRMFVYRFMVPGSWSAKEKRDTAYEKCRAYLTRFIRALNACDEINARKYHQSVCQSIENALFWQLRLHPGHRKSIIRDFKPHFLLKHVSGYRYRGQSYRHPFLVRLCHFPYFPFNLFHDCFVHPLFRGIYRRTAMKHTWHIGPLNLVSHVEGEPRGHWFVLGCKVK